MFRRYMAAEQNEQNCSPSNCQKTDRWKERQTHTHIYTGIQTGRRADRQTDK